MTEKAYDPAEWPRWMASPTGEKAPYATPEDVPEGWMTMAQFNALDHDSAGPIGGSRSGRRKPARTPRKEASQ